MEVTVTQAIAVFEEFFYLKQIAKERNACVSHELIINYYRFSSEFDYNPQLMNIPKIKELMKQPIQHSFGTYASNLDLSACVAKNQITIIPVALRYITWTTKLVDNQTKLIATKLGHSMSIMVNPFVQEIEIFDPNGESDYEERQVLSRIISLLDKDYPQYKIFRPSSYCPRVEGLKYIGPGRVQKTIEGDQGTCGWWTLYFIEYRLTNPDFSRQELLDSLVSKTPEELRHLIVDYMNTLKQQYPIPADLSIDEMMKQIIA